MATRSRMPAWVRRRISDRPAARWITWNAGQPPDPETRLPEPQPMRQTDYPHNVVVLFQRSA